MADRPHLDITSVASLAQRKAAAEQDQANLERQQRLQEIQQAVSIGGSIVQGSIMESKKRQQAEFADAAASMLSDPKNQRLTKAGSMIDPIHLGVPQMQRSMAEEKAKQLSDVMTAAQAEKANPTDYASLQTSGSQTGQVAPIPGALHDAALRAAVGEDPKGASDLYLKQEFPSALNPNSRSGQLRTVVMTFQGSKGARQVRVGLLGDKLVDPQTGQPFDSHNPAAIDSLPGAGFAERHKVNFTTPDGSPLWENSLTGELTQDAEGTQPFAGKPFPKLANPTDRQADDYQGVLEANKNLSAGLQHFAPALVGPVAGRVASVKELFNKSTNEDQAALRAYVNEVDIIRRHNYFGATLTKGEKEAFDSISMDTKISPKAFLIRARALSQKMANREAAIRRSAHAGGRDFRDGTSEPVEVPSYEGATGKQDLGAALRKILPRRQ